MQGDPQRVGGRLEQLRCHAVGERRERVVGGEQVVLAVDDERRIGFMGAEKAVERLADERHLFGVE